MNWDAYHRLESDQSLIHAYFQIFLVIVLPYFPLLIILRTIGKNSNCAESEVEILSPFPSLCRKEERDGDRLSFPIETVFPVALMFLYFPDEDSKRGSCSASICCDFSSKLFVKKISFNCLCITSP